MKAMTPLLLTALFALSSTPTYYGTQIGSYDFDQATGEIDTTDGLCTITNVTEGVTNPLTGTPYTGDLERNGLTRGTIQWRFGGTSPLDEGSYTIIGQNPYDFDVIELTTAPFAARPQGFVDKLPVGARGDA